MPLSTQLYDVLTRFRVRLIVWLQIPPIEPNNRALLRNNGDIGYVDDELMNLDLSSDK